jgi:hypothetical protein
VIPSNEVEYHEVAAESVRRFKITPGYTKMRDKAKEEQRDAKESIFGVPVESLTIEKVREEVRRYQRAADIMDWFEEIIREGKIED